MSAAAAQTYSNSTPRSHTFANLAHVLGGEALLRAANFATAIAIARLYGPAMFGLYATALAYATIATNLADNGLPIEAVRQVHRSGKSFSATVSGLLATKSLLLIPMLAALAVIGLGARISALAWTVAALIVLRTVLQSYCQLHIAFLKATDRMSVIGPIQAGHALLLLALLIPAYLHHVAIGAVLGALIAAQVLELVLETAYIARLGWRPAAVRVVECWRTVRSSATAGFVFTAANLVLRVDVIMLSVMNVAAAVGHFAAAQTVITIVYVVAWLFGSVLLPEMTRLSPSPSALRAYTRDWIRTLLMYLVPATLAAVMVGPAALRVAFGAEFKGAGAVLAIMLCAAPLIVCNTVMLNAEIAAGRRRTYLAIASAVAALAFALSFAGARLYGAAGVASALVLREAAMFLALTLATRQAGLLRCCALQEGAD